MEKIVLPKLGLTMEGATVVRWLKSEGDKVTQGEPVAEIEMEKANSEIESPCDGYLKAIIVPQGETVPVDTVLAYIAVTPEDLAEAIDVKDRGSAPVPAAGFGRASEPARSEATGEGEQKIRAAPAARRLARELGVELAKVRGTGPGGRIMPEDVRRARETTQAPERSFLERRRSVIATLARSLETIPHILVCREICAEGLVEIKQQVEGVTYTEILLKALALTVEQHAVFKTALVGNELYQSSSTNVGIVVDTGTEVVIPVVKEASRKSLAQLSEEVRDLTRKARHRQLKIGEVQGGTVSISNLGMYEVDFFSAMIPYGQVAILTVGRIRNVPVYERSSLVEAPRMWLNLVVDHRLIDGVAAAKALKTMTGLLSRGAVGELISTRGPEGSAPHG